MPHPEESAAAAAGGNSMGGVHPGADMGAPGQLEMPQDGRRAAKRELSQSKRAAQNRAAQRAFRQRKEGYIKKLELQVTQYKKHKEQNEVLQQYIVHLQSALRECGREPPPAPDELNASHEHATAPAPQAPPALLAPAYGASAQQHLHQQQVHAAPGPSPVDVAAQAVAGLVRNDGMAGLVRSDGLPSAVRFDELGKYEPGLPAGDRMDEDARTAQELTQLQRESGPPGPPPANM